MKLFLEIESFGIEMMTWAQFISKDEHTLHFSQDLDIRISIKICEEPFDYSDQSEYQTMGGLNPEFSTSFISRPDSFIELPSSMEASFESTTDAHSEHSSGKATPNMDGSLGLLEVEVVAAENVPVAKRKGGSQSPFVCVSFGRKTYKTLVAQQRRNHVWKQKIYLYAI